MLHNVLRIRTPYSLLHDLEPPQFFHLTTPLATQLEDHLITGLPWERESVSIPIWNGNGNDFKPMGIPTCGFCGFLWVFLVFLWVSVGLLLVSAGICRDSV